MTMHTYGRTGALAALSYAILLQTGCTGSDSVQGSVELIDHTTQALLSGDFESVNGTYTGCVDRSGSWSLEVESGAILTNAPLSVVLNDADCVLSLTGIQTTSELKTPPADMVLTASYALTASAFDIPIEFYANAMLDSVLFADDFTLTVLYSDDPELATGSDSADFVVQTASATATSVPAPSYTLTINLSVTTDAEDIVQAASGTADLTVGTGADEYLVADASGLDTFAELDAAYLAGTPAVFNANVPAAAFGLVGEDLTATQIHTLILVNTVDGVNAYQAFAITFNP